MQGFELGTQHRGPAFVIRPARQCGSAVGTACGLVELVGKFVDHHVLTVMGCGRTVQRVLPRQNHLPLRPGFTRQHLVAVVGHARVIGVPPWRDKGSRVDQNLGEARVVVRRAVQDQQAGLRGNSHADFVGDLQAIAPDNGLFSQKNLDVPLELQLQVGWQRAKEGYSAFEDGAPGRRKRTGPDRLAFALQQVGLAQEPSHEQQGQAGEDESRQRSVPR